ncbi:hypothetical protein IW140_004130 [Coemansia sp. RSA 1813]|nr:hypothetical protein EV178_004169 [Coemansia sp. RSA 1646]KAJ1770957.1 hypothetical protein LPJ74_002757 [Coemansia sp. RSA 1843]KAJ2088276.1 hypothetical protein IW138_004353 [Coemansia sp. RSA 986]KAJ2213285.1 hypothetical protein EV179_003977 [Coemansia sp. RSA 487]KAJ2568133.1 hypothetical protein IW140_004130 [Coemansia sp. RSA 1813]
MIIDTARPSNVVRAFGFGWPDVLRIRGSVVFLTLPGTLVMTAYSVGIGFLIQKYEYLAIQMAVMTTVSLVLSMLLVFRTNSAYDRYWEGRKTWQDIKVTSRNLIRSFWCCIMEQSADDSARKRQALKDIAAFVISVKHYLRGEDGIEQADYDGLLSTEFRVAFATQGAGFGYGAIPRASDSAAVQQVREGWERPDQISMPHLLLYEIQKFVENVQDNHQVHLQYYASMLAAVTTLSTLVGNCERILSTPIPLAYRIHLRHALYLYLLVLPWALGSMGLAKTVVLQFVISFMMIGIDSISREIQNPFGYDANDLPLDAYCDAVLTELCYALQHRSPKALQRAESTFSGSSADKTSK